MKTLEFKCSNTIITKNGREVKCNRFLCSISDRILLVCRKCGQRFSLVQSEDGRWDMTRLMVGPLRLNINKEPQNGSKSSST